MRFEMAVLHYSYSHDVPAHVINEWHKSRGFIPRGRNPLRYIGYHYVVRRSGAIELGRSTDVQPTHCPGYNRVGVLAICLTGSTPDKTPWYPTEAQYQSAMQLIRQYSIPGDKVFGHRDLYPTSCPGRLDVNRIRKEVWRRKEDTFMLPSPVSTKHVFPDVWLDQFPIIYLHVKDESGKINAFKVIATKGEHYKTVAELKTDQPFQLISRDLKPILREAGYGGSCAVTVLSDLPSVAFIREY